MSTTQQPRTAEPAAEAASGFYEPWTPAPGTRVRINTLGGECRVVPLPGSLMDMIGKTGHPAEDHGVTGVVSDDIAAPAAMKLQGHGFMVRFDTPIVIEGYLCIGGRYAAVELEPLLPLDDPLARREGAR